MFEAIPSINNAKEKSNQEQLIPTVELNETELNEFRKEIAETYRVPYKASHFKKLKRVIGAFVLAGMAVMANPAEGIAPTVSEEILALKEFNMGYGNNRETLRQIVKSLKEEGGGMKLQRMPAEMLTPEEARLLEKKSKIDEQMFKKVVISLKEKGGIVESPQLPNKIYKPGHLAKEVRALSQKNERPYFLNPEMVLGKDFVQKNPEEAREYMEKIKKTTEATVMLKSRGGFGSGVIINSEQGKLIMTNAHVVHDEEFLVVEYPNGELATAEVMVKSVEKDLAVLRINGWDDDEGARYGNPGEMKQGISLAPDKDLQYGLIAMIGNPHGYPFEAAIGLVNEIRKLSQTEKERLAKTGEENFGLDATLIYSLPDKRFDVLERYYERTFTDNNNRDDILALKGETKPGQSGGPIINLDKKGEPKLIGINQIGGKLDKIGSVVGGIQSLRPSAILGEERLVMSGGVSVKDIREFLVKNGFNPDKKSAEIRSADKK